MFEPNVEEILKLEPDVVFQWAQYGEELYKPLEDAGIPVICLKYGTQEDLETWIKLFGEVLDRQEQADKLITYQQGMNAKIKEKTENIAEEDKPRVLSLPYGDQLTVSGSGTYNDYYFGLTGAKNVASEVPGSSTQVSMEQIINWDPEIIYIGNFDDLTPQDIFENRIEGQDWAGIDAVKNGRVYKVPLGGYRWDPPNQESPLMWEWLMEIHHPELFDFNLRDDMKKFYITYYDYSLSDEEIEEILFTNLNNAIV
ncbi:ABC transporter substrate-binding protein [Methanospirillum sp.]|uniref:ABC transporter substrate-binding protein n=1 Tax=Methanospirillum sp. TaxID=45200 RepID=UPI0035A0D097